MRARGFVRALAETRAGDSASGHWVAETAWPQDHRDTTGRGSLEVREGRFYLENGHSWPGCELQIIATVVEKPELLIKWLRVPQPIFRRLFSAPTWYVLEQIQV